MTDQLNNKHDRYLKFVNTKFGIKLASFLGLPRPQILQRYQAGQPLINGKVVIGADSQSALSSVLLPALLTNLDAMNASVFAHPVLSNMTELPAWSPAEKPKALVFDATNIVSSEQTSTLYEFFHSTTRSVLPGGRVIVFGRPPATCADAKQATIQRALEGFTRSLAKELGKGINVQLVYVEEGAEAHTESTLRFLLSARSTYVSGQVIHISNTPDALKASDWAQPLAGKKVLVTGASQGIGRAIAQVLARDGAQVIGLDIPAAESALNTLMQSLNGRSLVLDLTSKQAPQTLVEAAQADGGWDIIVHNAGITKDKTIGKMPADWWANVVNLNLSAQEHINDALLAAKVINQDGRIICVSSTSGIAGNRGQTNYGLSKAGVIGMVHSNAVKLAEQSITINAVAPGFIETNMTAVMPFMPREFGRRLNSLSQGGLPVDVAETIAWFASPASQGITGNVVRVCGQSLVGA